MRISTAAVIRRGDRLLLVRRPPGGDLGGCWELPGGKVDAGESPPLALARELREELGVDAIIGRCAGEAHFDHRGDRFLLMGFEVELSDSPIVLHEHHACGYYTVEQALAMDLAPSDASLLAAIFEAR